MSPKSPQGLTFLTNEPGNSQRDRLAALSGHSRLLDWLGPATFTSMASLSGAGAEALWVTNA